MMINMLGLQIYNVRALTKMAYTAVTLTPVYQKNTLFAPWIAPGQIGRQYDLFILGPAVLRKIQVKIHGS